MKKNWVRFPAGLYTEDLKNGTCGLSSLVLSVIGRVQGNGLAISAVFTAKVAAWTTAQVSGDGRPWPTVGAPGQLLTVLKGVENR